MESSGVIDGIMQALHETDGMMKAPNYTDGIYQVVNVFLYPLLRVFHVILEISVNKVSDLDQNV